MSTVTLEDVVIDIDNVRKAIIEAIIKTTEKEAESKTELSLERRKDNACNPC